MERRFRLAALRLASMPIGLVARGARDGIACVDMSRSIAGFQYIGRGRHCGKLRFTRCVKTFPAMRETMGHRDNDARDALSKKRFWQTLTEPVRYCAFPKMALDWFVETY